MGTSRGTQNEDAPQRPKGKKGEQPMRNPQTKEPMTIAASKLPAFKAGKALKDAVQ